MEYTVTYYIKVYNGYLLDEDFEKRVLFWRTVEWAISRGRDEYHDYYSVGVFPSVFDSFISAARDSCVLVFNDSRYEEYIW